MVDSGTHIDVFIVTLPTCSVNTSITLDDESPTLHSFYPTKVTYNVRLYASPPLPLGNHVIRVGLLDAVDGVNNTSCLFFDYAVVNDTECATSSSTSSMEPFPTNVPDLSQKM